MYGLLQANILMGLETKGEVQVLDVQTGEIVRKLSRGEHYNTHSLAYSPNGQYLAVAWDTYDRSPKPIIQLLNLGNGQDINFEFDHPGYQGNTTVAFSPEGKKLAAASGQYIKIWEIGEQ